MNKWALILIILTLIIIATIIVLLIIQSREISPEEGFMRPDIANVQDLVRELNLP